MTPRPIALRRRGRKSAWGARPVTDRALVTPLGRAIKRAGGRSASTRIPARDCWFVSTSAAASPGRSIARRNARRSAAPATLRKEVETCGLCHARRAGFHEDWLPGQWLSQTHVVEALARTTYHADGQIRDVEEPYNYTPFKQSRMFAAGVTCSDCHEPHSAKLRSLGRRRLPAMPCIGQICRREASPPCRRRSAANMHLVPHADAAPTWWSIRGTITLFASRGPIFRSSWERRTPATIATATSRRNGRPPPLKQWFGPDRKGFQTYGPAFHAARADQADAAALLGVLAGDRNAPAVARASALSELASRVSPANIGDGRTGLADPDPMVRIGALDMLEHVPADQIWPLASPLLSDPVRGVRIRAASLLAAVPTASQPQPDRARFDQAAKEFIAAQRCQRRAAGSPHYARAISLPSADRQPRPRLNTRLR